jgi:uncharacterized damage-inducible protein DinB
LEAAKRLAPEALRRRFEIGQGSVWSSLVHLHLADRMWLDAFEDRPDGIRTKDDDFASPGDLAEAWAGLDREWLDYLSRLNESALDRSVTIVDLVGNQWRLEALAGHLQVCTHAAYTAAQVINMMRHLGVEPLPNVMLVVQSFGVGKVAIEPAS